MTERCQVCGHTLGQSDAQAGQWVAVEERLPEPNADVLILQPHRYRGQVTHYHHVARRYEVNGRWYWSWGDNDCRQDEASHWMPLPKPPGQGGEER